MRHPGTVAVASAGALIALALPALGVRFVPPDAGLLPDQQSAGVVDREIQRDFAPDPQYPIIAQWVTKAPPGSPPAPWVLKYRKDAQALDGVESVSPPTPVGQGVVRMDVFSGVGRATVRHGRSPDDELEHVVDANELGLKDTVRVNPNEIVEIAVRFETYSGRYMYHCHILEHEDRDMMRPIVIMPMQLDPFMS